jgi:hypothetical protein
MALLRLSIQDRRTLYKAIISDPTETPEHTKEIITPVVFCIKRPERTAARAAPVVT